MQYRALVNQLRRRVPGISSLNASDMVVNGITHDSRKVRPGYIFAALGGAKADGSSFIPEAVDRGAIAILSARAIRGGIPQMIAPNPRKALAQLAALLHGEPSRSLSVVGVTGTNGKTTSAYLIRHILNHCGLDCGLISTVECDIGHKRFASDMTTPESTDVQAMLSSMKTFGQQAAVMEVSSHALRQDRVHGTNFAAAIFTNLTQDHLDYHGTMEEYFEAKAELFRSLSPQSVAVINIQDDWAAQIPKLTRAGIVSVGIEVCADWRATDVRMDVEGTRFLLHSPVGSHEVHSPLTGLYNVTNLLGAMAAAAALGAGIDEIISAIATFCGAPGRLERVALAGTTGQPAVFVDYAHTPDALENVCSTLRSVTSGGRLITVFGCGGDRDRGKRPLMGAIAANLSDVAIVTSDNPRTENPDRIIAEILEGIAGKGLNGNVAASPSKVLVEADRARAIELAIAEARAGDVVLIAGKGHEDYQITGTRKSHFDDREVARGVLARRAEGALSC